MDKQLVLELLNEFSKLVKDMKDEPLQCKEEDACPLCEFNEAPGWYADSYAANLCEKHDKFTYYIDGTDQWNVFLDNPPTGFFEEAQKIMPEDCSLKWFSETSIIAENCEYADENGQFFPEWEEANNIDPYVSNAFVALCKRFDVKFYFTNY